MIGPVIETTGTVIAAEPPELVGAVILHRRARFAWRAEAEAWTFAQLGEGFTDASIGACAVTYFGPTDAPSNCWEASVEKVIAGDA